ncbi:MAG: hypothetical protein J6K55_07855 [Clostridia bacterium]|nr:hypothetical protein [Clostridia bacterium]
MSKQVSPFAALTGAEKQIRWLEYQSIRLPYVHADLETTEKPHDEIKKEIEKALPNHQERPHIPEVNKVNEFQKTRHSQYDAVISRMRKAELQTSHYQPLS